MTQEEKKILFKELCARLAYGVKVKVECTTANGEKIEDEGVLNSIFINEFGTIYVCVDEVEYELEDIKPYLRSMSSMTEEEREFLNKEALENSLKCIEEEDPQKVFLLRVKHDAEELAYLYEHHYDVLGLIPAGLAISTETFNPYKD